jgi:hypothetical protein
VVITFQKSIGHVRRCVVLAHAAEAVAAEIFREILVVVDFKDAIGETLRIVRLDQQTAARLFDDLRESTAARLDQRHATSHRFE